MYNLSLVLVVFVFSSDIGTELVTIETTRRGGSSMYRRCRCRTLLYLPCIFRLRTETIWVSVTLRILIVIIAMCFPSIHPRVSFVVLNDKYTLLRCAQRQICSPSLCSTTNMLSFVVLNDKYALLRCFQRQICSPSLCSTTNMLSFVVLNDKYH